MHLPVKHSLLCHCFDLTGSLAERMDSHWPAVVSIGSCDIDCRHVGGSCLVGGTVESLASRGQTHTHINISKDTLAASLCPLQSGDCPSSYAPAFPRGAQTCCAIRSSSSLFKPPPLSPNLIISRALPPLSYAPAGLSITRIRNIKTLVLTSGSWPSQESPSSFFWQKC